MVFDQVFKFAGSERAEDAGTIGAIQDRQHQPPQAFGIVDAEPVAGLPDPERAHLVPADGRVIAAVTLDVGVDEPLLRMGFHSPPLLPACK
ncbi:hypothetical protein OR16_37070 [Cupriavidus basilensis OR16]|uniref:Uncharacterized protein n=1 Tax=Cupriavidus basilensis OR16 TaxID=1127483 RepID=H1SG99_9BURK|nr:hypothetical protein OR16_37070 [Cupriavidus basilensis OR16]